MNIRNYGEKMQEVYVMLKSKLVNNFCLIGIIFYLITMFMLGAIMIYKVYTVFDDKTGYYAKPIFASAKGEAIRSFTEASNDITTQIGKYPEDFTLFEVGEYDDSNASFKCHETPHVVGKAIEFKSVSESVVKE